jgi:hypothetical protein
MVSYVCVCLINAIITCIFYFIFPHRRVREETRTVIRGVRLNRRFDLQMAHRKIN